MAMSIAFFGPPPFLTFPHKGGGDSGFGALVYPSPYPLPQGEGACFFLFSPPFLSPPPLWGRAREGGNPLVLDRECAA
jgi:hypothetical protein